MYLTTGCSKVFMKIRATWLCSMLTGRFVPEQGLLNLNFFFAEWTGEAVPDLIARLPLS